MDEKVAVKNIIADLIVEVLWDPKTIEAESDTEQHHVKVWKKNGYVKAEIRQIR